MDEHEGYLRIGELSQRTGVSPELLRAWQRRYGLLEPARSPGGFRLYTRADEERVRRMKDHLARGVAAAEAARLAMAPEEVADGSLMSMREELRVALEAFDEAGAQRVLDGALATFTLDAMIDELLLPHLHDLGERWSDGRVTVAQEHFASNLIRARLLALARGWDAGYGPRAVLACPEGELHDLGLVLFGVALAKRGWRVTFLGANTPLETVAAAASQTNPNAVVIAASDPSYLKRDADALADLARSHRVVLAGRGADGIAEKIGAELYDLDPVAGAERLVTSPT